MMKPTDEQLRDPKWWDENLEQWAVLAAVETDARGGFVTIQQRASEKHNGFVISHPGNDLKVYKRPTKPAASEWDGEGLPPVGCECEFICSGSENDVFAEIGCREVEIVAHDVCPEGTTPLAVFSWINDSGKKKFNGVCEGWFRPLRTKEQRQRDELVDLMEAERENYFPKAVTAEEIADAILARYNLEPKP